MQSDHLLSFKVLQILASQVRFARGAFSHIPIELARDSAPFHLREISNHSRSSIAFALARRFLSAARRCTQSHHKRSSRISAAPPGHEQFAGTKRCSQSYRGEPELPGSGDPQAAARSMLSPDRRVPSPSDKEHESGNHENYFDDCNKNLLRKAINNFLPQK
jgi:hypothetical protein